MKHASAVRRIELPHSPRNTISQGWVQNPLTQEMIRVLVVVFSGWVSAAVTLFYFGKFDLARLMLSIGFVTVLIAACSGLAILFASVIRYLGSMLEWD